MIDITRDDLQIFWSSLIIIFNIFRILTYDPNWTTYNFGFFLYDTKYIDFTFRGIYFSRDLNIFLFSSDSSSTL